MKALVSVAVLWAILAAPARAGVDEGVAAFEAGDYAGALAEWRAAAGEGSAWALFYLGLLHEGGLGVPKDDARAVDFYDRASKVRVPSAPGSNFTGITRAYYRLGYLHYLGKGVPVDGSKADTAWDNACRRGFSKACMVIGNIKEPGIADANQYVAGQVWYYYEMAARMGSPEAMARLGRIEGLVDAVTRAAAGTRAERDIEALIKNKLLIPEAIWHGD